MYIIAGLGNPGKQYDKTRHNIGFDMIDAIAKEHGIIISEKKGKAKIGSGYIGGQRVILVKPQTFMNLSGESLRALVDYYKADIKTEVLIIYDDISLEVGNLRVRTSGSAGGHNGIKSLIAHLNTMDFCRIRVGVGEKPNHYDLADYVLGHFSKEELAKMDELSEHVNEIVKLFVDQKVEQAMNQFNRKNK